MRHLASQITALEKAVAKPLAVMKSRDGTDGIKLRLTDIYSLRNAAEEGWWERDSA